MNSQEYRNLQEAYLDVYENEQLNEMPYRVVTKNNDGEEVYVGGKYSTRKNARTRVDREDEKVGGYRHSIRKVDEENNELDEKVMGVDPEQRAALAAERKSGSKRLPPSSGKEYAANQKKSISYMNKLTKNNKIIPGMAHEEVEEFDEGIGSAIKSLFGKKKKPEAPAPQSRGAQLRAKYNTGPEKTETSAKRKILDKTRARAERDEKEYGDSTYSKSVATKSREAHDKYLRAGYNKYGADRPDSGGMGGSGGSGRGNKARKRAAVLNKESYLDVVMNEEKRKYPYGKVSDQNRRMERKASAETNPEKQNAEYEKADRHFGIHKRVGNLPYHKLGNKENRLQPNEKIPKTKETNRFANRLRRSDGQGIRDSYEPDLFDVILEYLITEGYADTNENALVIMANMSEDWRESIVEGPNYDKNRQRAAKRAAERNEARKRGQTGSVPGIGYVSPRPERETYRDAAGVERHTSGARMPKKD